MDISIAEERMKNDRITRENESLRGEAIVEEAESLAKSGAALRLLIGNGGREKDKDDCEWERVIGGMGDERRRGIGGEWEWGLFCVYILDEEESEKCAVRGPAKVGIGMGMGVLGHEVAHFSEAVYF